MGNRHPHNQEACDSLVPEHSSSVNSRSPVASESANVTPLHRSEQASTISTSGRLNKSVSENTFSSSLLASAAMSASITPNVNAGAGPSSSNGVQRPSLKFSHIHGENVRLTNNQRTASRTDSFCKALAFSDRPIGIDEMVCLRFSEVKTSWSGVLRFGVTNMDPASFGDLPKYACPDMTSKEGTWAKAMSDRYCQQGNIMHFFVRESGEMYYGINGNLKGLFLSGINTGAPLFVVVDIYGNTTSVEFVDESEVPPLRRHQKPRPAVPPPPTIPPPAVPTEAPISQPITVSSPVIDLPTPTVAAPTVPATVGVTGDNSGPPAAVITPTPAPPVVVQNPLPNTQRNEQRESVQLRLARELEQRLNVSQRPANNAPTTATSSNAAPGPSRRTNDSAGVTMYKGLPITPLQFHATRGRTISFNGDRTVATRVQSEYCCGYAFTARPVQCNEKIVIQVIGIETQYSGGLGFGVTNCDPAQLTNYEFPDDADELLNRPEFWAVNKEYERVPLANDEMTYFINENGEVIYQKNREQPKILMHIDPTLNYYMLFDLYGRAQSIRCIGTTDARLVHTPPGPPTIPQHRRRQHQNTSVQVAPRRSVNVPAVPTGGGSSGTGPQPPPDILRQLQPYQQRASGLTVNLPPAPDVPRRGETGRAYDNAAQTSSSRSGSARQQEHSIGRHAFGQPPPRPSRPPPPAPPQRTNSVPTTQVAGNAQSSMSRPASSSAVEAQDNTAAASGLVGSRECSVCMDQVINSAVYPCGHMCMCYDCGKTTWQRQGVCPICRHDIKDILRIFPQ